ncbi:hypothetical protein F5Y01DRAFT_192925 [Xylaria sp. FL0043]|nr:hypothetical protein F5Y01DRAFT_192925 [Xylaria sp. FL0043]
MPPSPSTATSTTHAFTSTSTPTNSSNPAIPVVDLGPWYSDNSSSSSPSSSSSASASGLGLDVATDRKRIIAAELVEACRAVGFVYVVNHGMPEDLVDEAFAWTRRLFGLSCEEKMLAPHPSGTSVHRGYSWPGLEKVSQSIYAEGDDDGLIENRNVPDVKESYEIGSEDFAQQPNVWLPSDVLPGFREFTTMFYWRCFDVARELLRALALGIGLDDDEEDFFLRFHSGVNNQLRLLHYPPVEVGKVVKGEVARMPAHSDWGTITMLFQDSRGGLQVEDAQRPGHFVDATPLPGALVMNVGDLLMRWSNDYLKSTLHRVTLPPLQHEEGEEGGQGEGGSRPLMTRSRYSIPYFVAPDPMAVVECLSTCTNKQNPPRYPPITQEEYRKMRARGQYL